MTPWCCRSLESVTINHINILHVEPGNQPAATLLLQNIHLLRSIAGCIVEGEAEMSFLNYKSVFHAGELQWLSDQFIQAVVHNHFLGWNYLEWVSNNVCFMMSELGVKDRDMQHNPALQHFLNVLYIFSFLCMVLHYLCFPHYVLWMRHWFVCFLLWPVKQKSMTNTHKNTKANRTLYAIIRRVFK